MTRQEHRDFLARWLRTAAEDLAGAVADLEDIDRPPRHACFWAHLAAEKALKGVLIFLQVDFPKSHDLEQLLSLIPPDWAVHGAADNLESLSDLTIDSRYPGDLPDVSRDEAREIIAKASQILDIAIADLRHRGFTLPD